MTFLEQQEKGIELLQMLTVKAWESPAFKEHLIKNPVAAIEEVTGKDLSFLGDRKIIVSDQTDSSAIYINIAAPPPMDELELTEEQLELVAGGGSPVIATYVIGCAVGVGVCWLISKYT